MGSVTAIAAQTQSTLAQPTAQAQLRTSAPPRASTLARINALVRVISSYVSRCRVSPETCRDV